MGNIMSLEKVAVEGDEGKDHGHGAFKTPSKKTVKIGGKPVIVVDDEAENDDKGDTNIKAKDGSGTVKVYGKKLHRENDKRTCDDVTKSKGQSTVKCG